MSTEFDPAKKINDLEKIISELEKKIYFLEQENNDLRQEKEKFQLISDFTHDWDFWVNPRGEFIWISPSCYDLTGYSTDEFLKDPDLFFNILYPEDEKRFRQFFQNTLNFSHIDKSIEFRIITRTKQLRWFELNTKSIFNKMGNYLGQRASIRDITSLISARVQISEFSGMHLQDIKMKERYRNEIAGKDRELVTSLIRIAQKNEMFLYLRKNLSLIKSGFPSNIQKKILEMLLKIDQHLKLHTFKWDDFTLYFEKVHPGFFVRLKTKYPILTMKDHRLCAYIRLGLSTKEIAGIMNITPESAEMARIRLRKKLNLNRESNLTSFFQEI